jgi:hypothetical protein
VYWLVLAAVLVLEGIAPWGVQVIQIYRDVHEERIWAQRFYEDAVASGSTAPRLALLLKQYGSPAGAAVAMNPYPRLWDVLEYAHRRDPRTLLCAQLTIALLVWPWLTALALLVFRQTMRKTRIHSAHVVRCAVYSSDSTVLILPLLIGWFTIRPGMETVRFSDRFNLLVDGYSLFPVAAMMISVLAYRLGNAYRQYLRFPHPFTVAIASQLIVALTLLAIAPWTILW